MVLNIDFLKISLNLPHKVWQPQSSFESVKTYDFALTFQHVLVLLHYIMISENLNTQLPNSIWSELNNIYREMPKG